MTALQGQVKSFHTSPPKNARESGVEGHSKVTIFVQNLPTDSCEILVVRKLTLVLAPFRDL